jgi:hypothetical protein
LPAAALWSAARPGSLDRLPADLLRRLKAARRIDWNAGIIDGAISGRSNGNLTGASPVDRARVGAKHHAIVDPPGADGGLGDRRALTSVRS